MVPAGCRVELPPALLLFSFCRELVPFLGWLQTQDTSDAGQRGYLDGQLLVAMPGMLDANFERTVIYVCAHSEDGAMGFILNRARDMSFPDLLVQLDLIEAEDAIRLPGAARDLPVQIGGPVDTGRGFVLHSHDYLADSTIPVSNDLCLTATTDILRAISGGQGTEARHDDARLCELGAGPAGGRDRPQRLADLPGA